MPVVPFTKGVLRRCHLMRPFTFDLPPELWVMIFNLLLEPIVAPYKYCTPDTISYHRTEQYPSSVNRHRDYATHYFLWDNRPWLRISLVCRAWASLVGTQPLLDTSSGHYHLRAGVRSIKYSYPCNYSDNPDNPLDLLRKHPQVSVGLTTLAIMQVGYDGADHLNGVKVLLDDYQAFPMLRSLRIDFSSSGDIPHFWNRLEKGFPNLISLCLSHCPSSVERITFKQLEILIIWATEKGLSRVLPAFFMPRLQHAVIMAAYFVNSREFLEKHGHQLQSLSFPIYYRWPWSPAGFWELLPNLLTLEISADAAEPLSISIDSLRQPLPPIPPTHPLRRLVLIGMPIDGGEDCWGWTPHKVEELRLHRILLKIPTIEIVSITESLLRKSKLKALRRLAAQRGITFEVHAVTVPCPYRDIREHYRGDNLKVVFFYGVQAVLVWGFPLASALANFVDSPLASALLNFAESVLWYSTRLKRGLKRGYYKLTGKTPGPLGIL